MTTPSQPTELDKAVERVNNEIEIHTFHFTTHDAFVEDIKQLLLATKRAQESDKSLQYCAGILKDAGMDEAAPIEHNTRSIIKRVQELEKKRDEARDIIPDCAKEIDSLRDQLSQLRIEYKKALEALKGSRLTLSNTKAFYVCVNCGQPDGYEHTVNCVINKVLTTQLAIETMKEKKV